MLVFPSPPCPPARCAVAGPAPRSDTPAQFTNVVTAPSCPWVQLLTDDNIPYYYSSTTGESTWEMPEEYRCENARLCVET